MYKYRSRTHRSRVQRLSSVLQVIAACSLVSAAALVFPTSSNIETSQPRIFTEGLKISIDRASPPFAALEDTLFDDLELGQSKLDQEKMPSSVGGSQYAVSDHLVSGTQTGYYHALQIVRDNRREYALMNQARLAREAQAQALADAAMELFRRLAKKQTAEEGSSTLNDQGAANRKNPKQFMQRRDVGADLTDQQSHSRKISLTEMKISRDELLGGLLIPLAASLSEKPLHQSTIQRPISVASRQNNLEPNTVVPSAVDKEHRSEIRQAIISGPIEFQDGLALTNPNDRLVVYRQSEGESFEAGMVWIREGRYEIFVEQAEGALVAELRTPAGQVLGRGNFDLTNLTVKKANPHRIGPVPIKIQPVHQGIGGIVVSARSTDRKKTTVAGAKIELRNIPFEAISGKDGRFEQDSFMEGSSAILRASQSTFWSTVAFGRSGSSNHLILFPGDMIHSFIRSVAPKEPLKGTPQSVIWGRVLQAGKPVKGAQVELMTSEEEMTPVYFNSQMAPDPSLTSTSENGIYAFYPVSVGVHAVRSLVGQKAGEPVLFAAEQRAVSYIEIENQATQRVLVRVFDAFRTDWPLQARVSVPGSNLVSIVEKVGDTRLPFAGGSTPLVVDVDAGLQYESARYEQMRDLRYMHVPMVQKVWLDQIRGSLRLNSLPHTGTIIGFIQGQAQYKVAIEDMGAFESSRLVYFNSEGKVTNQEFGEAGGGFILFNVPQGYRAIAVQPSGVTKVFTKTVLVESQVVNIISQEMK